MRIFHEDLLQILNTNHINSVWAEGLQILNIILYDKKSNRHYNHPQTIQYKNNIKKLVKMLILIKRERYKRNYKAKIIFDKKDNYLRYLNLCKMQEGREMECVWQSKEKQIDVLREKGYDI